MQVLQGDGTSTQMRESIWVFGYMSASVGARGSVFAIQAGIGDPTLPDASLQTGYVYGDDLIAQTAYTALAAGALGANAPGDGGNDALARIGAPTGTRIAYVDGLGSTRLLTAHTLDAAGQPILTGTAQNPANETVTDRYAYSAFGDTDLASSTIVSANAYRYTGEQLDPNLGWYYLRARYMNPGQGRFVGMDPFMGLVGDAPTLHRYLYAGNDPILYVDPSGELLLVGLDLGGLFTNIGRTISLNSARITANRIAGKALERFVEAQLNRFVAQYGGTVLRQVYFKGRGGVRFADFVLRVGDKFVAIEVKTNFPLAGSSLVRLAGQIRTFFWGQTQLFQAPPLK